MKRLVVFVVCCLLWSALAPVLAVAQTISVFDVDASAFPRMSAKFAAFDADWTRVVRTAEELRLTENGAQRQVLSVSCPDSVSDKVVSAVLALDVSGSMRTGSAANTRIEYAKSASRVFVRRLLQNQGECAITSFDGHSYIESDFTTDSTRLLRAIARLTPRGSTSINRALFEPLAGALPIAKRGRHQKFILLMTDGRSDSTAVAEIIAEAKVQLCRIYVVAIGNTCPDDLRTISTQTGG